MPDTPHELEFWLPAEFLTDDDILMDGNYKAYDAAAARFPFQAAVSQRSVPFPTSSALGSPVESVVGSTETESDEEDALLAELTRQLTLLDANRFSSTEPTYKKNWVQSGSPQSTLGGWSVRSTGSSNGSPNGPSQVSSPPTSPLSTNINSWEMVYKAAGVVDGFRSSNCTGRFTSAINSGILEQQRFLSTHQPPKSSIHSAVYPNHLMQNRPVRNGPSFCNLDHNPSRRFGSSGVFSGGYGGWPNAQIGPRNNQKLVPGVTGAVPGVVKSERVGTGVFLPRIYGDNSCTTRSCNTVDSRKRSVPSAYQPKKVPAMNKTLNYSGGFPDCHSQKFGSDKRTADYDTLLARRASMLTVQKAATFPEGTAINGELCLPQDWTY